MEKLTQTIDYIEQGLAAHNETDILPVFYDTELDNGIAFTAYRLKRFVNVAGKLAGEACHLIDRATYHVANN